MALLSFLGAIRQVTGSCYLLETHEGKRVLLECGMHQGRREEESSNRRAFPFRPKDIDAVVISHAHIDHSGLLPRLTKEGYRGPIFATEASCALLELMLHDAAHLQEKDAEWENKWRARRGQKPIAPLYTGDDADQVLRQCRPLSYQQSEEVVPGVRLTFHDAGHILGSAIVQLDVNDLGRTRRLVFSGDLGNDCTPLMRSPAVLEQADVLLMESTYGDRDHRCSDDTLEEFLGVLQQAHKDGGNVLIPAFAIGRTQDLIYHLGRFYHEGRLPQQAVFLDSPMAIRANAIYSRYLEQLDPVELERLRGMGVHKVADLLPILRSTATPEESMAINRVTSGAIIIAGSGMCNGGRILHHFKHNLWRPECHVVFTGFQARGTLGRAIVDGADRVRLLHQQIMVKAKVHTLGGFSAHAGQSQLLNWASHFSQRPELHLVHGELEKMLALQGALRHRLGWEASIPEPGDRIAL